MDKNQELCRLLGLPWHEHVSQKFMDDLNYSTCSCGNSFPSIASLYKHLKRMNPDYTSDAGRVRLLREMRKREDWSRFKHDALCMPGYDSGHDDIPIYLILNTIGKLRDVVIEWLRRR